jgi:hypothetical protein
VAEHTPLYAAIAMSLFLREPVSPNVLSSIRLLKGTRTGLEGPDGRCLSSSPRLLPTEVHLGVVFVMSPDSNSLIDSKPRPISQHLPGAVFRVSLVLPSDGAL